jgi:hypothetical protein
LRRPSFLVKQSSRLGALRVADVRGDATPGGLALNAALGFVKLMWSRGGERPAAAIFMRGRVRNEAGSGDRTPRAHEPLQALRQVPDVIIRCNTTKKQRVTPPGNKHARRGVGSSAGGWVDLLRYFNSSYFYCACKKDQKC